jgi:hypothetical protein
MPYQGEPYLFRDGGRRFGGRIGFTVVCGFALSTGLPPAAVAVCGRKASQERLAFDHKNKSS